MQETASSRCLAMAVPHWPAHAGPLVADLAGSRMKGCQHAGMCSPTAVLSAPLNAGQAHSAATRLVRGLNSRRDEF